MSAWPGLAREDVEELAANYSLTIERVRAIAHERYPDNEHEAEQLTHRATQNVRNALLLDLRERGCPLGEIEAWFRAILHTVETRAESE